MRRRVRSTDGAVSRDRCDNGTVPAPADSHAHSQWSWDARHGSMNLSCARAVELGLPAVAFTEHVDFTPFRAGYLREAFPQLVNDDGILVAPEFDAEGYFDSIEECRSNYPDLTILTGLEVGQPHRHRERLAELLGRGEFQRVLGSLHCLRDGDTFAEPFELFPRYQASKILRDYLEEIPRMVAGDTLFEIVSHIDYAVRLWPDDAEPFSAADFEEEFRDALRAIAVADRILEVSAKLPLDPTILGWWCDEGGNRITFGSDGHEPWTVGRGLAGVATMAESFGFEPARKPHEPWHLRA